MATRNLSRAQPKAVAVRKTPATVPVAPVPEIPDTERYAMIREAAYYRAEHVGFCGDPVEHWLAAEEEISRLLSKA